MSGPINFTPGNQEAHIEQFPTGKPDEPAIAAFGAFKGRPYFEVHKLYSRDDGSVHYGKQLCRVDVSCARKMAEAILRSVESWEEAIQPVPEPFDSSK